MIGRNKSADKASSKGRTVVRWGIRLVLAGLALMGARKAQKAGVPQRVAEGARSKFQEAKSTAGQPTDKAGTETSPTPPPAA